MQVGGISPTPSYFRGKVGVGADVFGDGWTMIITPLEDDSMIWAYVVLSFRTRDRARTDHSCD